MTLLTYDQIHDILRDERGPARLQNCVDCPRPADHWSFSGDLDTALWENCRPYSDDVRHYDPRCAKCHRRFDIEQKYDTVESEEYLQWSSKKDFYFIERPTKGEKYR